ncbi:hypothetical protein O5D80_001133 [Batrachochytrium dendrobatidis]|nr:hypothetical protein O5D80_001133 [Batrachochytrium dendrobatidis]
MLCTDNCPIVDEDISESTTKELNIPSDSCKVEVNNSVESDCVELAEGDNVFNSTLEQQNNCEVFLDKSNDDLYEFNAPKFHDFTATPDLDNNDEADKWFDVRETSIGVDNNDSDTDDIPHFLDGNDFATKVSTTLSEVHQNPTSTVSLESKHEQTAVVQKLSEQTISPAALSPEPPIQLSEKSAHFLSESEATNLVLEPHANINELIPDSDLLAAKSVELETSIVQQCANPLDKDEDFVTHSSFMSSPEKNDTVDKKPMGLEETTPKSPIARRTRSSLGRSSFSSSLSSSAASGWLKPRVCTQDNVSESNQYRMKLRNAKDFNCTVNTRINGSTIKSKEPGYLHNTKSNALRKTNIKSACVTKKVAKKNPRDLTIPKPFSLHSRVTQTARSSAAPVSPYVSLAVKVQKFQSKTPDRFRTKAVKLPARNRDYSKLTQPKSPFLTTRIRAKPFKNISTQEQIEEEQLANCEKFKAKPINPRILAAKQPLGVPAAQKLPLTVPMSPAITKPRPTRTRKRSPAKIIKANPIPDLDNPFVPSLEHRKIEPVNFSLPGDPISKRKHQEFIEAVEQENAQLHSSRQFHAQPILSDKTHSLPYISPPQLTQPRPFALHTDTRGALHRRDLEKQLAQSAEEEERQRQFHANPVPDLHPFVPKKSSLPLTEIQEIVLHTDIRAEERGAYEDQRRQREQEEAQVLAQQDTLRKKRDQQEIRQLRQRQTHRAQPIRHFNSVQILPSSKKLTEPCSPAIGNKRKASKKMATSSLTMASSVFDEHQNPMVDD